MYYIIEEGHVSGWAIRQVWIDGERDKTLARFYDKTAMELFLPVLQSAGYKDVTDYTSEDQYNAAQ